MAEFWTTEQVAEHLGITIKEVYESARANRFPGNLGKQRGRRKLYRSDLILAGPQEPKTTSDAVEAILWVLNDMQRTLGGIHTELRRMAATQTLAHDCTEGGQDGHN